MKLKKVCENWLFTINTLLIVIMLYSCTCPEASHSCIGHSVLCIAVLCAYYDDDFVILYPSELLLNQHALNSVEPSIIIYMIIYDH